MGMCGKMWSWFKNQKISRKLLISNTGIILIMSLLIGGVGYDVAKNILISRTVKQSEALMGQLSSNMNYAVGALENLLTSQTYNKEFGTVLGRNPGNGESKKQYDKKKEVETYGYNLINFNKYIKNVIISDNFGNTYSMSDGTYPLAEEEPSLDYDRAYEMWGPTYWKPYTEELVFATRVIFDYTTMKPAGMIAIGVDASYFKEMYGDMVKDDSGSIVVMNRNEEILLSSDEKSSVITGNILSKYPAVYKEWGEIYYKNDKYLYVVWPTEGKRLQLMFILSDAAISAEILQVLRPLVFVTLAAVILSGIFASMISRQITSNIKLLMSNIQRISQGDFSRKIIPESHDETGILAERFNDMSEQIQKLIVTVSNEKVLKKNSELKALQFEYDSLQAKINPHFLYNTLESINSLAKLKGEEQIADSIYLLGNYLREAISSRKKFVTLEEEIQNIRNYVEIQKLSYGDKISVNFELDEALMEAVVPKLILQPLVENAIVHGIEPKIGNGLIRISASCEGADMRLTVWDNGVGISEKQMENVMEAEESRHTKVGLMAVHKRIQILYGMDYGVAIQSSRESGTEIAVRLPIKLEDEV